MLADLNCIEYLRLAMLGQGLSRLLADLEGANSVRRHRLLPQMDTKQFNNAEF